MRIAHKYVCSTVGYVSMLLIDLLVLVDCMNDCFVMCIGEVLNVQMKNSFD